MTRIRLIAAGLFLVAALPLCAQAPSAAEARTNRAFEAARKAGAPELYAFLKPFPKGADLHMHLSGAVYAETFIADAVEMNLCVDTVKLALVKNAGLTKSLPPQPVCPDGTVPAANALKDQRLYDALVDSFSMRSFVASAGVSGHDQFFNTFDRFGAAKNPGKWLDEVASRAAAQNEQYLEIMQTPSFSNAITIAYKLGWPADFSAANHMQALAALRDAYLAGGLRDDIAIDSGELADAESRREGLENCGPHDAAGHAKRACDVKIHFLYQVLRGFAPQQVFAQTLLGFELASAHPEQVVGINFVRAEDRRDAMAEYHTEMLMLDYLHSVYPKVRISLHAGELAFGMVPPKDMTFHIHEALDLGHAERIGHGMDVLYEHDSAALIAQMAKQHTMVEINLTSNDVILGLTRTDHPLHAYMAAHVPWALSTDDEGVSRIDLTHEYVKGVLEQGLTYADLKQSARTSLEHAFLAGPSLWVAPDVFTRRVSACTAAITASPAPACAAFLAASERATQQYELEGRLAAFEGSH